MSAPDTVACDDRQAPSPQRFATIVIVGGGCYGSYYHRQLQRAARAGAIVADRLLVVDRDPACLLAQGGSPDASEPPPVIAAEIEIVEWSAFFERYLTDAARNPEAFARDAIVPSPLMPHLMGEWLVRRARERFGDRVSTQPFDRVPTVPWERAGNDGTHYVSFATWMCPINCIEPRICPHTRDVRSWSMPERLAEHARAASVEGQAVDVAVLHCEHRAYGVGMFDTRAVADADARIRAAGDARAADVIIGTVSHCHGALTRLVIAAPQAPAAAGGDSHIH